MRKIVYFDENSATDYLTILNGGTLLIIFRQLPLI